MVKYRVAAQDVKGKNGYKVIIFNELREIYGLRSSVGDVNCRQSSGSRSSKRVQKLLSTYLIEDAGLILNILATEIAKICRVGNSAGVLDRLGASDNIP